MKRSLSRESTDSVLLQLQHFESRNVTFIEADGSWPIVWERAKGVHVWDPDGRRYLDLTAAFGVAATGHANPRIVQAGQKQMAKLLHAMGDVHPHALKAELARELSRLTFERWTRAKFRVSSSAFRDGRISAKVIFCNSGFEAVEAALKTALLATGRSGVIAFEGAYHGLGYGTLNITHRDHFRGPFRRQLPGISNFVSFPSAEPELKNLEKTLNSVLAQGRIGVLITEPIQARGGIRVPPADFLPMLRRLCDRHGVLLVVDEVYTGFGRTGEWFACESAETVPDVICLGKAMTGGFPLSACVGRAGLMDSAWPKSSGEAIHTSTFLGHPVGCAMALASIEEIRRSKLIQRSRSLGTKLLRMLQGLRSPSLVLKVRGVGLMVGLELRRRDGSPATGESLAIIKRLLHRGFIFLPEGEHANVIGFTPPLVIAEAELERAVNALADELGRIG